jgi:KDO2-lipid IV(A) lauroyltransferase
VELSVPLLQAATTAVRWLPEPLAAGGASAVARVTARLSSEQRLIAERNMRRVFGSTAAPELIDRAVVGVFDSYSRYWHDTLRLPYLSVADVERGFSHSGIEHLLNALDSSVGPILALPHLGGWEWAARWLISVRGWEVAAVAETLDPPELFEWFLSLRRSMGLEVIPLGPSAGSEVAASLAAGRITCLLADRDLTGTGIEVEFFGETTRLPGGPALMALRSGAALLPTAVYFERGRCHAVVDPPLDTSRQGSIRSDVTRVTQDLARALERQIRCAPEQWHLLQPNWRSDYEALGLAPPA